jgi:hypothetical protein
MKKWPQNVGKVIDDCSMSLPDHLVNSSSKYTTSSLIDISFTPLIHETLTPIRKITEKSSLQNDACGFM